MDGTSFTLYFNLIFLKKKIKKPNKFVQLCLGYFNDKLDPLIFNVVYASHR